MSKEKRFFAIHRKVGFGLRCNTFAAVVCQSQKSIDSSSCTEEDVNKNRFSAQREPMLTSKPHLHGNGVDTRLWSVCCSVIGVSKGVPCIWFDPTARTLLPFPYTSCPRQERWHFISQRIPVVVIYRCIAQNTMHNIGESVGEKEMKQECGRFETQGKGEDRFQGRR